MSFRLADGTFNTDYKIGDKFKVVANDDSCSETTIGEIVILTDDMYSQKPFFDALDGSGSGVRCCTWYELVKYEGDLYTQSELSEIEELRDRVEYLESLCKDYAKIVVEKDARISYLLSQLNNRSDNYDVYGYVNGVK